jgi:xyloglucan fucosyltransferase
MMQVKKKMWLILQFGSCNMVNMLTPLRRGMGGKQLFVALACSSLLLCSLMVLFNKKDFTSAGTQREKSLPQAVVAVSSHVVPPAEVVTSAVASEQQQTGIDPLKPLVGTGAPNINDQVLAGVSSDQETVAPADQQAPSSSYNQPVDHQPAASASPIGQPAAASAATDQPAAAPAATDQPAAASAATDQPTVAAALDQSAASSANQLGGTHGTSGGHGESITTTLPAAAEALIQKLRAVTLQADGGEPVQSLTESERNSWHQKNPCISREKLPLRYAARKSEKHVDASPAWDAVLHEYEILHQTCTTKVQDISLYFLERNTSSAGCNYLVCDAVVPSGLGNKILITASCLVYAVLTQRVLLLPSTNTLADIVCEPFEGSSWKVNEGSIGFPVPSAFWLSTEQFLSEVDSSVGSHKGAIKDQATAVHATDVTVGGEWRFQPHNRFFCTTEQKFLRNVTWVHLVGNQHFLPKLFVIPSFRTTLESLFPSRMVLTDVIRHSMLPVDSVWQQVDQVHEMQPDHADQHLGVQIHYTEGHLQHETLHPLWEMRIKQCALDNGMLPQHRQPTRDLTSLQFTNTNSSTESDPDIQSIDSAASAVNRTTTVFITSLYDTFERSLSSDYMQEPPANGEHVTVVQLNKRHDQYFFSREEDEQALVEIILLSLSDNIIVTPGSTFGYVAHSYGALQPWVIATQVIEGQQASCFKGQTVDACYHIPEKYLSCPHDPKFSGSSVHELVPYIKDCLPGEHPHGIQLITL